MFAEQCGIGIASFMLGTLRALYTLTGNEWCFFSQDDGMSIFALQSMITPSAGKPLDAEFFGSL